MMVTELQEIESELKISGLLKNKFNFRFFTRDENCATYVLINEDILHTLEVIDETKDFWDKETAEELLNSNNILFFQYSIRDLQTAELVSTKTYAPFLKNEVDPILN